MTNSGPDSGVQKPRGSQFFLANTQAVARAFDGCGEVVTLRPQQRLPRATIQNGGLFAIREGLLALDVIPPGGHRQILDFLMPGDVVPAPGFVFPQSFSIRAITPSIVMCRPGNGASAWPTGEVHIDLFLAQCYSQLARRNIHQIMIGQLDTESRVASFLLSLAMRRGESLGATHMLELPMSRDDIADYLAINHDTLSRMMMRFETLGLVRRINRHAVHLTDIEGLGRHTPIGPLLLAVFARPACAPTPS